MVSRNGRRCKGAKKSSSLNLFSSLSMEDWKILDCRLLTRFGKHFDGRDHYTSHEGLGDAVHYLNYLRLMKLHELTQKPTVASVRRQNKTYSVQLRISLDSY